jgi:hypothetical protein
VPELDNQEDDRLRVSAEVDEGTLREICRPAFGRVVTGCQPWTLMCAYNKLNGTYASEHRWLLTELLRDEWGFEVPVADWGAVHDRVATLAALTRDSTLHEWLADPKGRDVLLGAFASSLSASAALADPGVVEHDLLDRLVGQLTVGA